MNFQGCDWQDLIGKWKVNKSGILLLGMFCAIQHMYKNLAPKESNVMKMRLSAIKVTK